MVSIHPVREYVPGESLRLGVSWHGIRWEKYEYPGKVLGWKYLAWDRIHVGKVAGEILRLEVSIGGKLDGFMLG